MQETSPTFEKIIKLLKENNVEYELIEHEPVYTSEEAARVRGTSLKHGAKAIVFSADKQPILVVVSGDKKVDIKIFKKRYGIKDLRILSPAEVKEKTDLEIGAIPPFGNLMGFPTYMVDQLVTKNKEIIFNAGSHTKSIKMKPQDYIKLCNPIIGDFSS